MIIIGLTGSIGMGKSTVTKLFAKLGAVTCDSDLVVHRLLSKQGAAVEQVEKWFPGVVKAGAVDRALLGQNVFGNPALLKKLEAIMHPLVRRAQEAVIRDARRRRKKLVVLDIPLLFETGAEKRCDYIVVTTAPFFVQRHRVLQRKNMTEEKFTSILKLQVSDREKRRRADFIVQTGQGRYASLQAVKRIVAALNKKSDRNNT